MFVQDWPRFLIISGLAIGFSIRIYSLAEKVREWKIGSTETSKYAEEIVLPSITICMLKFYQTTKSENILADYKTLPKLEDILTALIQRISAENGQVTFTFRVKNKKNNKNVTIFCISLLGQKWCTF